LFYFEIDTWVEGPHPARRDLRDFKHNCNAPNIIHLSSEKVGIHLKKQTFIHILQMETIVFSQQVLL
jgi:hypothetical protein